MADDVDQADAGKGTSEEAKAPAKKAVSKKPAAKRTQAKAKKASAAKSSKASKSGEGGTGRNGRMLPVDRSGLSSISQDALNPAFAQPED